MTVPGQHETGLALPWGGTSHPVWFSRDPRVANVQGARRASSTAPLMLGVPQIVAAALEQIEDLPEQEKLRALAEQAAAVMNQMPPRENTRINTSLDSVHASGPLGRAHCVIHGNCNYKQTGLLQAYAAYSLLQQPPQRAGFASGCQAFGHRELLGVLRSFGLVMEPDAHQVELSGGLSQRAARRLPRQGGVARRPGDAPCLTMDGQALSYADVQRLSWSVGRALARSGIRPGDKVAMLSATTRSRSAACSASAGPARSGARSIRATRRRRTANCSTLFDCRCLIFAAAFAPLVAKIAPDLPKLTTLVCLDEPSARCARGRRVRRVAGRGRRRAVAGRAGR